MGKTHRNTKNNNFGKNKRTDKFTNEFSEWNKSKFKKQKSKKNYFTDEYVDEDIEYSFR